MSSSHSEQSYSSCSEERVAMRRIRNKYAQLYEQDHDRDPYYLELSLLHGWARLVHEFHVCPLT